MVEYGLMVALIAVGCLMAATMPGVYAAAIFQQIANSVSGTAAYSCRRIWTSVFRPGG